MWRLFICIILISLSALIDSCGQSTYKQKELVEKKVSKGTGQLIPINFRDSVYHDLEFYARDTITIDGWTIEYLVKDDSTKYQDVYIQWKKGNTKGLFYGGDILLMRRYFTPILLGENNTHIFLEHGCATTCSALLALSKDSIPEARDFIYVRDYNIKNGQVVFIPERSYSLDTLEISVVDLTRQKEKSVIFENVCNLAPEEGCIDSISFNKNYVKLSATLIAKRDKPKSIKESHTVRLDD